MKISVIITAYQSEKFILQCLDSICFQNVDEVLLGIDGCDRVTSIIQRNRFPKLNAYLFEKTGTYIIRNTLAQIAKGDYLLFIDSDDVAGHNMVEVLRNQKAKITRFKFWDFENELQKNIPEYNQVACGCFFIEKQTFLNNNGFKPFPCSADYEFKLRSKNQETAELEERLFYRRKHPNQLTANNQYGMHTEARRKINATIPEEIKNKPQKLHTTGKYTEVSQKRISFNLATYPKRKEHLQKVINSILPQTDVLRIYLNECQKIPKEVINPKIEYTVRDADIKDTGKFYWLNTLRNEYYFTADDDILYDPDYAMESIQKMRLTGAAICTVHGRIMNANPVSPSDAKNINHFFRSQDNDFYCNYCGTGATCVDNSVLSVNLKVFETNGMTDQYFNVVLQENKIPILCRAHKPMKSIPYTDTLWGDKERYKKQNAELLGGIKWKIYR